MELKDFVAETIVQICEGIQEANKRTEEYGCVVCPQIATDSAAATYRDERRQPQIVNFNVAITVKDNKMDIAKGGSFAIGPISANKGVEEGSTTETQEVNRVSFSLPVLFPSVEPDGDRSFKPIGRAKNLRTT